MGFYGNITNTSKTQFQFDKIYANRYDMERSKSTDGIYAGRYVLVEYDTKFQHDNAHQVYLINGEWYTSPREDINFKINAKTFNNGDIVYTSNTQTDPSIGIINTNIIYYQVIVSGESVKLNQLVETVGNPAYTVNYNIDVATWGAGRGYDSTVWQKAYMDGQEKYIMIAELNSVVPTFDVSADAPTMAPLVPHFDTQSTDIYYKLHWQPSWGFRIAEAQDTQATKSEDTNVGKYPSDVVVSYDNSIYNPSTGKNETSEVEYNGAVYFNKAGFDLTKHNYYSGDFETDEIAVRPTGISGNLYNLHDGSLDKKALPDIQEMRIILPSLGNTLCKMWDIIYDYDKDTENRKRDIEWKDASNNVENTDIGGMTRNPETLAGCINITHDLMGMIITEIRPILNEASYNKHLIYKIGDEYQRIRKVPKYTSVDLENNLEINDYETNQEYNAACNKLIKDFLKEYPDKDWYTKTDNGYERVGDKSLLTVSNIAYWDGYSYELVSMEGFAKDLTTVNGLLLEIKNVLEREDINTRNPNTVQGAINSLNDIINVFRDIAPNELVITNNEGKITTANWTTKQLFTYTNHGGVATVNDDSEKENQWIELGIDEENNKIKLFHKMHSNINSTNTFSDKNNLTNGGDGLNKDTTKDEIALYTPIVDNCGHVVGKNTETVVLPYGYKYLSTSAYSGTDTSDLYTTIANKENGDNSSSATATISSCEAETTQDKIQIAPINKWVQTRIINENGTDTIQVAHEVHAINEVAQTTNLNTDNVASLDNNDKITVQDIGFDKAGHAIKNQLHTYTLPYGFKIVKPKAQSDATNNPEVNTMSIIADNTQDTLLVASSNKWIRVAGDDSNDTLSIGHEVHEFSDGAASGKYYGLTQNESIASLDENNKFEVPCLKFDEAGHITGARTHTVELPENFSSIDVSLNDNDNTDKTIGTEGTITADSLIDKLTISEGNRWINIDADSKDDRITFSHYVKTIPSTDNKTDYNDSEDKGFTVQELNWDKAGHIVSENVHAYTLPDSFKTITVNNSDNTSTNIPSKIANGNLTATTLTDTAIIDTGNRWVKIDADPTNKKMTIYHAAPGSEINTTKTGNETPIFGKTFDIPEVKYDEAGHISKVSTHTVQLPLPSLNDLTATSSSVITGISMNDATGAITQTNANVGSLALTGYKIANVSEDISELDTINSAFGQAQFRINTLETNLTTEVKERKDAITQEVSDRNAAITNAINTLDVGGSSNISPAQTISSWSEIDGKVNITLQNIKITNDNIDTNADIAISKISGLATALANKQNTIPDETYDAFGAAATILGNNEDDETKLTIYGLLKKIEALEERISALETADKDPETPTPDIGE